MCKMCVAKYAKCWFLLIIFITMVVQIVIYWNWWFVFVFITIGSILIFLLLCNNKLYELMWDFSWFVHWPFPKNVLSQYLHENGCNLFWRVWWTFNALFERNTFLHVIQSYWYLILLALYNFLYLNVNHPIKISWIFYFLSL